MTGPHIKPCNLRRKFEKSFGSALPQWNSLSTFIWNLTCACIEFWLQDGGNKEAKIMSRFCFSPLFAPPSVEDVPLLWVLILSSSGRGWSEVRPIHLHPHLFAHVQMEISAGGGINMYIFLKVTAERFVPNGDVFTGENRNFQRTDWILWFY